MDWDNDVVRMLDRLDLESTNGRFSDETNELMNKIANNNVQIKRLNKANEEHLKAIYELMKG